jgi:hypothetical protein
MFVLSPIAVWSIAPVSEPDIVPVKKGFATPQPLAYVGLLLVL